jgi:hypothetical protein
LLRFGIDPSSAPFFRRRQVDEILPPQRHAGNDEPARAGCQTGP